MNISIIVPCRNIESYIKPLLLSFHMLNLNNISYEILFVVEADTTDNTINVINQYMFDMNYQIITSNGGTLGLARNTAMQYATGDYIWFVDGDDWIINPEVLQQIIYMSNQFPNENILQIEFVSNYFKMKHYSMVWQYIFKREFLSNLQFSSVKYHEDNEFSMQALKNNGKEQIPCLSIPSYFYNYLRPGSNTMLEQEEL